jgi:hypothetical protein
MTACLFIPIIPINQPHQVICLSPYSSAHTFLEGVATPIPESEDYEEEVDAYTNHDLVERAFEECDLHHEGRLNYEEFKMSPPTPPFIHLSFLIRSLTGGLSEHRL